MTTEMCIKHNDIPVLKIEPWKDQIRCYDKKYIHEQINKKQ